MAMPAIAPLDRPLLELAAAGGLEVSDAPDEVPVEDAVSEEVDEDVGNGVSASSGKGSPGNNMKEELAANCFWTSSETLALGLMTPTICQSMHDPGAPQ